MDEAFPELVDAANTGLNRSLVKPLLGYLFVHYRDHAMLFQALEPLDIFLR